jgi:hypothetical protein
MAWPLSGASDLGPMAGQRESKLVGEVGVCAKALQQWTRLVSTARYPDCIHGLVMTASSNVRDGAFKHQNRCSCEQRRHVALFLDL